MTTSVFETGCLEISEDLHDSLLHDQDESKNESGGGSHVQGGCCAICLDEIVLQETAMVKGCEHVYCVTCILRWASYRDNPICPQCKNPFEVLNVHRALDGSLSDFMFEESVYLLLGASWFEPLVVENRTKDLYNDPLDDFIPIEYENYDEDEDDDELDDLYFQNLTPRLGNRRWGDSGYVRAGRVEARPVHNTHSSGSRSGSSSRETKNKEVASKPTTGRRAKRAMKREAANKAAAATAAAAEKQQESSVRFGRD